VAEIMEGHRQMRRPGPERSSTRSLRRLAAAVGAREAIRAEARITVLVLFLVAAPAADVLVPAHDARAGERVAQNLLRVGFAKPLRSVGRREEQGTFRVLELVHDPWTQRSRNRKEGRITGFGGVAVVRARHGETC